MNNHINIIIVDIKYYDATDDSLSILKRLDPQFNLKLKL